MIKEELKKQIELLVKDDEKSQETIIKQSQEIERLNNIINEVRECVETAISEDYYDGEIYKIKEILNKGE